MYYCSLIELNEKEIKEEEETKLKILQDLDLSKSNLSKCSSINSSRRSSVEDIELDETGE